MQELMRKCINFLYEIKNLIPALVSFIMYWLSIYLKMPFQFRNNIAYLLTLHRHESDDSPHCIEVSSYDCCHQMSDFKAKMQQIRFRLGLRRRPRWI